jgi:hypothetical protein
MIESRTSPTTGRAVHKVGRQGVRYPVTVWRAKGVQHTVGVVDLSRTSRATSRAPHEPFHRAFQATGRTLHAAFLEMLRRSARFDAGRLLRLLSSPISWKRRAPASGLESAMARVRYEGESGTVSGILRQEAVPVRPSAPSQGLSVRGAQPARDRQIEVKLGPVF